MERPVVGSDAPGLGSAIEDGVTGLVVPQDDPDKLAAALLRLIDDRDEARALGARARSEAQRKWTIGACADSYERLYERLADRRVA
jgi:glycosyltransferase involved in cell wall biosynthesis